MILFVVLCVFGLCASEGENVGTSFFDEFYATALRAGEYAFSDKNIVCSSRDGAQKVRVKLFHSERRGSGNVEIVREGEDTSLVERFVFIMSYSVTVSRELSTRILYAKDALCAKAKVEDCVSLPISEKSAHVALIAPSSPTIDWFPEIIYDLRPDLYWTFGCDGEYLTFTRFIFFSKKAGHACFFSIEVLLKKLSQGRISWGDMSLTDYSRDVVGCRNFDYSCNFLWTS